MIVQLAKIRTKSTNTEQWAMTLVSGLCRKLAIPAVAVGATSVTSPRN